jgi:hypothetical protein
MIVMQQPPQFPRVHAYNNHYTKIITLYHHNCHSMLGSSITSVKGRRGGGSQAGIKKMTASNRAELMVVAAVKVESTVGNVDEQAEHRLDSLISAELRVAGLLGTDLTVRTV